MNMKKAVMMAGLVVGLALAVVPRAEASSFLSITVDGTTVTCTNTGACGAGFTTALNSNTIVFTGTVNGVSFGSVSLSGNSPGSPAVAFVLDSKFNLQNFSGVSHTITVDFGQNNFTQPVGAGFLNASQTANWTLSSAGDSQAFQSWLRNDNALTVPGGNTNAISPNCVSPGGLSQSCASETLNVPATPTSPFALTGRQVITMANGTVASYSGTATLTANAVPEPGSLLLLGSGLLFAYSRLRRRRV